MFTLFTFVSLHSLILINVWQWRLYTSDCSFTVHLILILHPIAKLHSFLILFITTTKVMFNHTFNIFQTSEIIAMLVVKLLVSKFSLFNEDIYYYYYYYIPAHPPKMILMIVHSKVSFNNKHNIIILLYNTVIIWHFAVHIAVPEL